MKPSDESPREGSLEAPTRHAIEWRAPDYTDAEALQAELTRVFDVCHGCRRCFSLCNAFPTLFDAIDESPTGELGEARRDRHAGHPFAARRHGDNQIERKIGLRHQVELFTARVEAAQQLALHAARLYDLDRLGSGHASMAKALAATTAIDLSRMLSRMLPLESQDYAGRVDKFGRDARAFVILEGTGDIQRLLVARSFNPVDHRPWRLGSGGRA